MKSLFDELSYKCSRNVTLTYSTSFSTATRLLSPSIRAAIHSIYGFVRFADEIVDSFHGWDKEYLLSKFESDYYEALETKISLNPILNSFQDTVRKYNIEGELVMDFLNSMKMDLHKTTYSTKAEYDSYIYGSADVVGLMCLKVFVNGNEDEYEKLKHGAMHLGSAFQKVNFLRDFKDDTELLNRSYFPHVNFKQLTPEAFQKIILEIEGDFKLAYQGIIQLPSSSRLGVYLAYVYFKKLLNKLKKVPVEKVLDSRIRIPNHIKLSLLVKSYFNTRFKLL